METDAVLPGVSLVAEADAGTDSSGSAEVEFLRDLLGRVLDEPLGAGLIEDIAYAIGRIERWRCQDCNCVNGAHEGFCYRCGAGPEEDA